MKFEELIAELDVRKVAIEPEPINSDFVSLGELLLRLQTTLAKPLTLTQAAHILLSLGFRTDGAPEWKCNGKLGIVPIEAFNYEWAVKRLEYVFHSNRFESDGNGASTDYDFFGFDRKEFADFLSHKVGEPLDLFCPMPEPQADTALEQSATTPPPGVAGSASGGMNWTLIKPQRFQGYGKPLYDLLKAAHIAGQPCPKARDVLDKWKENPPPDVATVTDNGLKYYDANGNTKPADLEAIRKAIDRMIR